MVTAGRTMDTTFLKTNFAAFITTLLLGQKKNSQYPSTSEFRRSVYTHPDFPDLVYIMYTGNEKEPSTFPTVTRKSVLNCRQTIPEQIQMF